MRLWSLHPKYLDSKGLVALWREALLAKKVLEQKTKGYKHHPQLVRFKESEAPLAAINQYLQIVCDEASARQYHFDASKIETGYKNPSCIKVTKGQLYYEVEHLLQKLKSRDQQKFKKLHKAKKFQAHPLFKIVNGNIEDWEIF